MLSRVQSVHWGCLNISLMFLQCFLCTSFCHWRFFRFDQSYVPVFFLWSKHKVIRDTQTTGPQTDNEMPMLNTLPPFLHPESLHQPFPSPPRATSRSFPTFAKISWAHRDACLLMCFSCVFLISGRPCRSQKKGHMKKGKTETIYISSKKWRFETKLR